MTRLPSMGKVWAGGVRVGGPLGGGGGGKGCYVADAREGCVWPVKPFTSVCSSSLSQTNSELISACERKPL